MNPEVLGVKTAPDHKLIIEFANHEVRELDMRGFLDKGVFRELRDADYFAQVRVAFGALEWPNHQDLSKDTAYLLSTPLPDQN